MVNLSDRRRFLAALVSLSSATAASLFADESQARVTLSAPSRDHFATPNSDDAVWAFQLGNSKEDLISTGAVFRSADWDELGSYPGRGAWTEREVLRKRHASRYRMIQDELQLFDAAISSHLFVAIANPDEKWSWRRAVECCVAVSRNGVATILIAARQEPSIYEAEELPIPYREKTDGAFQFKESEAWRVYSRSAKQLDKWSGNRLVEVSRENYQRDREEGVSCVVEVTTGDIYLELTSTIEAIGTYWPGLIGTDFTDIRIALGLDRAGWKSSGTSYGENRAVEAAEFAMAALEKAAHQHIGRARGVLISVLTGPEYKWREFGKVLDVIAKSLPDECHIVLDHVLRADFHTFLQVDILVTADGEDFA